MTRLLLGSADGKTSLLRDEWRHPLTLRLCEVVAIAIHVAVVEPTPVASLESGGAHSATTVARG